MIGLSLAIVLADPIPAAALQLPAPMPLPPIVARSSITTVDNPVWARMPTQMDLDIAVAGLPQTQGGAVMECIVATSGGLEACKIEGESWRTNGFGYALLSLRSKYLIDLSKTGSPNSVGKRVRVSAVWGLNTPASSSPPEWPAAPPAPILPMVAPSTSIPVVVAPPYPEPPRPKAPSVITNPQWITRPAADDYAKYYPREALQLGVSGHTSMECTIRDNGTLENCHVLSETPAGQGFGSAVLRLASKFRMQTSTVDGQPVGGARVVIPISWVPAAPPEPPAR